MKIKLIIYAILFIIGLVILIEAPSIALWILSNIPEHREIITHMI